MPEYATPAGDPADPGLHRYWVCEKVRYRDTDRQGHVNNAVFATFLESGRVPMLYDPETPLTPDGASFVIARLVLDFRAEIRWPAEVDIGTTITRMGRSSITLSQGLFVDGTCAATAETVIVMMDDTTRQSRPLPAHTRDALSGFAAGR